MADQDMINLAEYLKFKPFPEKLVQNLNNNIKQGESSQKWNFSRELEWLDAIINLIEFGANPEPVLDQVIQLIDCSDPDVLTKVYLILNHVAKSDPDLSLLAINKVLTYSSPSNSQMLFHMDLALNFLCILCEGLDPPTLVKDCFNEIRFNTNAKIKKYYYLGMYNNFKFLKFADLNRCK
ncbi:hypothetical protein CONCODRAFT_131063 [Conidiobolus coronatus NRRL 28638]|uniref:Uncharacterized protein n=1 Tax=Conidiobolus coronatus (strain ATCC 28846 / CBS 209.66 / NRRL 28638) TaxID=796925 RepID=A0A137PC30_CONC2|nr:hypothetical protein CONCODRAFT_131063 [Conidiobolus coronatus NRRL 28638]|eukprot:KXN72533.1 hypothetical protein CONCODRAFT_131063 [Conidiobolus coronatus NRRL 28638]